MKCLAKRKSERERERCIFIRGLYFWVASFFSFAFLLIHLAPFICVILYKYDVECVLSLSLSLSLSLFFHTSLDLSLYFFSVSLTLSRNLGEVVFSFAHELKEVSARPSSMISLSIKCANRHMKDNRMHILIDRIDDFRIFRWVWDVCVHMSVCK